jgi:D-galactarolactone cycloisomerase
MARIARIARVEVFEPTFDLPRRRIFSTGGGMDRGATLVKISDTDGAAGWGETYPVPAGVALIRAASASLVGRDPQDAAANWDLVARTAGGNGFPISAISIALDDLRARQLGISVATLYGGAVRSRVRAYASSEGYVEGEPLAATWIAEAERAVAAGYLGFKLRIGRKPAAREMAAAADLRRAMPDLDLMADGNAAYALHDAVRVGHALHDLGFGWFEEPLPTEGYVGYEALRERLPLALAGGESIQDRRAAQDVIDRGAFDLIQPDVSICGGVGETIAIGGLARLAAIGIHPHACNGAIGLAASLQALAVLSDPTRLSTGAPLLEVDFGPNPTRTDLLATPLRFAGGWLTIPDGPGLGVDVDEDFVRRHDRAA